ncbi:MAG: VOC family protein [Polyangiales bacterium]
MTTLVLEQQTTVLLTSDVARLRAFFVDTFSYEVTVDIGWFVSLRHPALGSTLDLWSEQHESARELPRGAAGFVLAYLTPDVALAEKRAVAAGAEVVQPLRDEPWGQRHVLLRVPGGPILDLVQRIAPDPKWLAQHGLG